MTIFRVTLTAQLYGSICQNVWHLRKDEGVIATDVPLLATRWRDAWMDVYKNMWVSETTMVSIRVAEVTSAGEGVVTVLPLSMTGGSGNDVRSPLMMSLVIQVRTGVAGRTNRGRFFVGGQTVGNMINGLWTGTWMTTISGYLATLSGRWVGTSGTEDFWLVILGPNDDPLDARAATSLAARTTPGTQRRRELGVGI